MEENAPEMNSEPSASEGRSRVTAESTPNSREPDRRKSVVRTPLSGMSSSLKERLKKCGRYHPATPPSGHPPTPTSSLHRTPFSGSHTVSGSSTQHQGTPTSHRPTSSARANCHSPNRTQRALPTPRNILKENFILSNHCEGDGQNLESYGDPQSAQDKKESGQCDLDETGEEMCLDHENSSTRFKSVSSPVINALSFISDSADETLSLDCEQKLCSDKDSAVKETSAVTRDNDMDVREAKKRLTAELYQQREVLRKLQMVKTYRAKHDLLELQSLIDKWRSACQQAILDLHQLIRDPRPSLTQLVRQLGIDMQLVRYDEEDESFQED